jgi:D-threo-aldose 1-dehydrogenase
MTAATDTAGLGGSGVEITALSLGTAPIGNLYAPVGDEEARATVDAAWEAGVRCFDTAPHYGIGLAERRLGEALGDRPREQYTISTKVGRILEPVDHVEGDDLASGFAVPATHRRRWDFTADGVLRSLEESLTRLGLSRVDIVYLHDPDDHARQALDEAYPALERLRSEGVIGAIGVGMNQTAVPARFVTETDIDAVLLAGRYTLLEQEGLVELLPLAERRGVGIVVGGVFNSGLLADPRPGATYNYTAASEDMLDRALRLQAACAEEGLPLRAAALHFPFGHPAVTSVLLGARSPAEVRDAASLFERPVPPALWEKLRTAGLLPPGVPVP